MMDKYGATPALLISQASCLIQQQKYEDAEKLLQVFDSYTSWPLRNIFQDAQQRDPNNAEALIGLFVVTQFLGKPIEVCDQLEFAIMNNFKRLRTAT